jgi:alpha-glucosidase
MKWDAQVFKRFIDRFQAAMGPKDIPIYVLGNHDKPRLASRIGDAATRTAAVMLLTLPGTPFIYNGEEIGMHNGVVPPDRAQDPVEKRGATAEKSRDGERTPLQWSDAPQAGFSTAQPWLPVAGDYASRNIAGQLQDPGSLLSLYRQLTRLRRASDVLRLGEYRALATSHPAVFGFRRQYKGQELVVILNFSDQDLVCATTLKSGHVRLSSYLDSPVLTDPSQIALRPNEGMIIQL